MRPAPMTSSFSTTESTGIFRNRLNGVVIQAGFCSTRIVRLTDRLGSIRFYPRGAGRRGGRRSACWTARQRSRGSPTSTRHPFPSRATPRIVLDYPQEVIGTPPAATFDAELYAGIERSIDVPISIGAIAAITTGPDARVRIAPAGAQGRILKETWTNRNVPALAGRYDVWIDGVGMDRRTSKSGPGR